MVWVSSDPWASGVCAVCFRVFKLDGNDKLFRHVRKLGKQIVCAGSKFRPAGVSLDGTRWALDRSASKLAELQHQAVIHATKPLLDGIGPYDGLYESRWNEIQAGIEMSINEAYDDIDWFQAKLNEWQPTAPELLPTPIHLQSLWRCLPGTVVPLCFAKADHRPSGDPTLTQDVSNISCPTCILSLELNG